MLQSSRSETPSRLGLHLERPDGDVKSLAAIAAEIAGERVA